MKTLLPFFIAFIGFLKAHSQEVVMRIESFEVKESLANSNKIAIIATDSLNIPNEKLNGTFKFVINGFEKSLEFHDGVAVHSDPIEGSTFVYFKHKNQDNTIGNLYFLFKKATKINPIKINGLFLILIPIAILLIAYVFKRFISTFIILFILYFYFSYSKGLKLSYLLESITSLINGLF